MKSETRRKVRVLSPAVSNGTAPEEKNTVVSNDKVEVKKNIDSSPKMDIIDDDVFGEANSVPMNDLLPSSPVAKAVERKSTGSAVNEKGSDNEDDDMMVIEQTKAHIDDNPTRINMDGKRPPPKIKAYPSPESSGPKTTDDVDPSSWNSVTGKLNVVSSPATDFKGFGKIRIEEAIEEDGSLNFFWLDFTEIHGSLCLFGKVKNKRTGEYSSAFVKVDNILRKLYFLPRQYRQRNGRDTDEEVDIENVYEEVDELMSRMRVKSHKIKECTRKYAFEIPGIPKETEYLKLMYPYDSPAVPLDTDGQTFSHVFGTNTAMFEQFVLWKGIMGPCWLKIEDANYVATNGSSWCKFECQVPKPAHITPIKDSDAIEPPRLTLMSLALRTQLNSAENKQEILVASARVYENISLDDPVPAERLPCKVFTVMRPLGNTYPVGFEAETRKHRGTFMLEKSEQFLLSKFLALFERIDPDVLMGHQLQDVDFNILLSRLKEKSTPGWHRIGRLKRSEWPKNFSRASGFYSDRQLVAGRLICDLANDMGKV